MVAVTLSLFPIGDKVTVARYVHGDLALEKISGVVEGYRHLSTTEPDVVHIIRLDSPIKISDKIEGRIVVEPAHEIDRIDSPASNLA